MRILHTSDWHIGRTFHTHSTLEHLGLVLGSLCAAVREQRVDVVLVAGDVFDSGAPSADAIEVLTAAFRGIREAGARIVMTSGNHDSVVRLGMHAEWIAPAGLHVLTRHEVLHEPVTIDDEHGPVHFYGIPYLEPSMLRAAAAGREMTSHGHALAWAMDRVRADLATRGGRAVVLAHCFTADVEDEATDVERDISSGGLNLVAAGVFDGVDYAALGHIHGRKALTPRVRYSGAPLHYSFAEAHKPRGGWLLELGPQGLGDVTWLDLPVPRRLTELTGTLESLLDDPAHAACEQHWVKAVLTDPVKPIDAMRRLQARFPHCVALEVRPAGTDADPVATYGARVAGRSDLEILDGFLGHVRGGLGASDFERRLVDEMLTARVAAERSA